MILTRTEALSRLAEFLPHAGADYARMRNLDRGPGRHVHVSRLSAALRRRVITEEEVARTVWQAHGMKAEKFLSEVLWRTYWKGWLESRPAVWRDYLAGMPEPGPDHEAAVQGRTGIDAFDGWMTELRETGYLHNWARMQFASIWVFTLGLPWQLGAALTLRLLADGDPASNTLSWRWVAGLHTAGKTYLSDAARITEMTGGRFHPQGLARVARGPAAHPVPKAAAPRAHRTPDMSRPAALLLTVEDLSPQTLTLPPIAALTWLPAETEPDRIALADGVARARAQWPDAAVLGPLGAATDLPLVTGFAPVGPVADRLSGLNVAEVLRDWDARTWPHCTRGFFALKEHLPRLMAALDGQGRLDV